MAVTEDVGQFVGDESDRLVQWASTNTRPRACGRSMVLCSELLRVAAPSLR
jgi:hypothetical protein